MWRQTLAHIRKKQNLFMGGGGMKTLSFIGALDALGPMQWKTISGVSAGAILALLLVLGNSPHDCMGVFLEHEHVLLNCLSFERLCNGESPCNPEVIRQTIIHILAQRGFASHTTFATLASRRSAKLGVVAFCVETSSLVHFTAKTHPNMSLCDALMSSVALPMLFPAIQTTHDTCTYYDAGIISSSPLGLLDAANTFAIIVRSIPCELASGFPETVHIRCGFRMTMAVEYAHMNGMSILQIPSLANGMTLLTRGHNSVSVCMNMGILCFALYAIRIEIAGLLVLMLCCRSYSGPNPACGPLNC